MRESLNVQYFDTIYKNSDDPWNFATSEYEQAKYTDTLQSLPSDTYKRALEIGCSIGVLTERLASKCEQLLAVDVSEKALAAAKKRCQHLKQVRFLKSGHPADYLDQLFDLIVLSEVAYYWSYSDLKLFARQIIDHLSARGQVLLVHWTDVVADYPLTGDQVHEYFLQLTSLRHLHGHRKDKYRLDLFERR